MTTRDPFSILGGSAAKRDRTVDSDETRLLILDALLACHDDAPKSTPAALIVQAANKTGWHRTQVGMVAGLQGWPNVERVREARDRLAARLTCTVAPLPVASTPPRTTQPDEHRRKVAATSRRLDRYRERLNRLGGTARVRRWAIDHDYQLGPVIRREVLDAYEAAHSTATGARHG